MLIYAESDAGSVLKVAEAAADQANADIENFTQYLRSNPSTGHPKPFLDGVLAKHHRKLAKGEIKETDGEKKKRRELAAWLKARCEDESDKRNERHEINMRKKKNGAKNISPTA